MSDGWLLAIAMWYAQREGFAEADPKRDLSGEDAEDKLRVLAWLAFGIDPASLRVVRRGIDQQTAQWAADAAREGHCVPADPTMSTLGLCSLPVEKDPHSASPDEERAFA